MTTLKTIDIPKVEQDMADQLYQENDRKEVLGLLDKDITSHQDQLRLLKLKNQKTEGKLPTEGETMLNLIAMVAELDILKAKKTNANKVCDNHYSIDE